MAILDSDMNEKWVKEGMEDVDQDSSEAPSENASEEPEEIAEEEKDPYEPPPDAVRSYLKNIRRSTLLTFEEEVKLAKRIKKGDEKARARMEQAQAAFAELTLFDDEIEDEEVRAERRRLARAKSGLGEAEVAVREARLNVRRATFRSAPAAALPGAAQPP